MSFRVQDPLTLFSQWLEEATATEVNDPNAMALATLDSDGTLSNRIVLLKGHDGLGFRFFTNFEGRKGRALRDNPRAAALFHWKTLDRQAAGRPGRAPQRRRISGLLRYPSPWVPRRRVGQSSITTAARPLSARGPDYKV